ncbi:MAG: hypothetical protein RR915_06040 [Cellulosilyticaceae bacterium]
MKKLLKISLILSLSLSLMGCSMGQAKTEDITDQAIIDQMNTIITDNVATYFQTEVSTDIPYEYSALKRFIGSPEDPKVEVHHANVFQASYNEKDATEGTLVGYGGILTPDNSDITGLIINLAPAQDAKPQAFSETDLVAKATNFLSDFELVPAGEEITFLEVNGKASSSAVSILNFETASRMFAVGIDLYSGQAVYFEFINK